jgi:pimeloyl-ACP methyl ester carboxylesterase
LPGSTPSAADQDATGAVASVCGPPNAPGKVISFRAADGVRLAAIEAGAGVRGVVMVPELGSEGKCGWWDFGAYLAAKGYHVLLLDHRCTGDSACPAGRADIDLMADIRGAVSQLRRDGADKVALVGGSQGASEALIAATMPPHGVVGVVAMSADELAMQLAARPYPQTAVSAPPRLHLPVLFAVAKDDPYVSVQQTRELYSATRSRDKHLIVLPESAGHGWDFVSALPGGRRPGFANTVVAFLQKLMA